MLRTLLRVHETLASIEYLIVIPMFLGMLGLMIIQVVCRYFLHMPLGWSEELTRYIFISTIFMGGAIATKERNHIEINFLNVMIESWFNTPKRKAAFIRITNFLRDLIGGAFLSFIFYETWSLFSDQVSFGMVSPAIQMPLHYVTFFMMLGIGLMVIHSILLIILNLNGLGATGYEEEGDEACSL